ncbi:glutaredoxin [Coprinopsis marcescibilis]|uniref:glutathione peroxidase n=1 Tax=Coprinopsis marcescibilis TaxID=230819 RepID=A0A5C3KLP4_COPMA|nr:glutaredoxin [Coprinopsis marcescibilis]
MSASTSISQGASIAEFVDATITKNQVVIFSKSYCPYCKRTKALFAASFPELEPEILELDERDDGGPIQQYLAEKTGQRTVPNVFVATKHIGGNDDTHSAFKAGKLAKLLEAKATPNL